MRKINLLPLRIIFCFIFVLSSGGIGFGEDKAPEAKPKELAKAIAPVPDTQTAVVDTLEKSQNVTLDFKDADIRNVLKIISYKAGVNIVTTPEVIGDVTIRLVDVPWEKAMDVILRTYGFAYEKQGNIITVAPLDKLTTLKKQEVELAEVQPTVTEVFNLKYLDALDAKKALEPQLSPRGKITVLEMTGQAGWEFGAVVKGESQVARKRKGQESSGRSKILIISDVPPVLDKIREVIAQIDLKPQQILIEARIIEVARNKLLDIGMEYGTGSGGAESTTITTTPTAKKGGLDLTQIGAHAMGGYAGNITPSIFGPKESTLTADNAGLKVLFKKLSGAQFEAILHALEEDVNTNTLSSPRIMALNNQEASILIGTKYPILRTDISSGATAIQNVTLDYYQDVGIQLNVVPQVGADGYINMVIHPAVSTITTTDSAITSAKYPVIDIREAETRILMRDGETIVIGGLLKDVRSKENIGIPFLSRIPWLKWLFSRDTTDTEKVDLLIFITANIVKEGGLTKDEIAALERRLERAPAEDKAEYKKRKKKPKYNYHP